ncbi:penicillin-binding protein activator [Candidatus Kaiserbacteria bacterium]|nr:penicillin-binding protein activator [Candidatus Kaiserbacteria bacterium]
MNSTVIKWVIGVIAVVLIVWLGYSSFSGDRVSDKTGPIKIGVSLPLTGEASAYGEAVRGGVELAAKEFNDQGGINGRVVELIIEDDKCNQAGSSVFNKLVNVDKVHAIIGPLCSAAAGPGLPVAQSAGIPTIVVGSAPALTSIGDFIFRVYPSDALQGKVSAEFIFNELGKKNVAVVYVQNDWGQGIQETFIKRFKELGGTISVNESVLQDSVDLRTQLTKVKSAAAEALYFPVYVQNAIAGVRQIRELGLNIPVVAGDVFADESIFSLPAAEGIVYIQGKSNNPEEFQNKVLELSGVSGNAFTPYFYDAVRVMLSVIKDVGTDPDDIKKALVNLSYDESIAVPKISFDEVGDLVGAEVDIRVIQNGKSVPYSD